MGTIVRPMPPCRRVGSTCERLNRVQAAQIVTGMGVDLQGAGAAAEQDTLLVLPLLQSVQPGAQRCRQLCISGVPAPGA